jgi:glycerol kinase
MKITMGSGAFVGVNTGSRARANTGTGLYPMVAWKIKGETTFMIEGMNAACGTAIDWARSAGLYSSVRIPQRVLSCLLQ